MENPFAKIGRGVKNAFKSLTPEGKEEKLTLQQLVDFLNLGGVPKSKLSEATYFACLKILSESLGKLPLQLLQNQEKGGVRKAVEHPLYSRVRYRPNRYMTATTFWSTVEINRNHYGNAYVWIQNPHLPEKTQLWILESDKVQIYYDDQCILADAPEIWYVYSQGGRQYKFSSAEIMHFKTSMTFDGVKGMPVIDILRTTVEGAQRGQQLVNRMYETGFTAKAVVQQTSGLSEENARIFAAGIEKFATGQDDMVKTIIPIPPGSQLTPLNIKFTDAEFMAIRKYTALQIAAAFGIKPNQINDYEKASYASAEAQQLAFYVDTMLWILKQYEEETTYMTLDERDRADNYHWKFNVSVMLRADTKTQLESLVSAVQGTIYTPNEAREHVDKPALPGGDQLMCNGSNIPLTMIGDQYSREGGENQ